MTGANWRFGIASVSGTILAVCSCTVLPLFGGLYKRGAGLGPAIAFLYSGPAIAPPPGDDDPTGIDDKCKNERG